MKCLTYRNIKRVKTENMWDFIVKSRRCRPWLNSVFLITENSIIASTNYKQNNSYFCNFNGKASVYFWLQ